MALEHILHLKTLAQRTPGAQQHMMSLWRDFADYQEVYPKLPSEIAVGMGNISQGASRVYFPVLVSTLSQERSKTFMIYLATGSEFRLDEEKLVQKFCIVSRSTPTIHSAQMAQVIPPSFQLASAHLMSAVHRFASAASDTSSGATVERIFGVYVSFANFVLTPLQPFLCNGCGREFAAEELHGHFSRLRTGSVCNGLKFRKFNVGAARTQRPGHKWSREFFQWLHDF
ncbi:hypothetical protein C8R45DRAFT_939365 [Mycena sanguinolenta]|nr:hypothetical protein C8R45DRAFT_939365 [Mycena sanguinolenta]